MNREVVKKTMHRFPSVFSSSIWDDLWDGFSPELDFDGLFNSAGTTPYDVVQIKDKQGNITGTEFQFALAGFSPEEVKIEVDENELKVKVEKSEETKNEENEKVYVHRGLARRKMEFSYVLTGVVDKDNITASFEDGMLKVNLPSLPKKECKKIEVKSKKQIAEKTEPVENK